MRFFTRGVTKMLHRCKGEEDVGMVVEVVRVTGSLAPFPTVTKVEKGIGVGEESVPEAEDMCVEAPMSRYHSPVLEGGVATPALFRAV
jgi:hypothetical protein